MGFLYAILGRQADRVLRMQEIAIARIWRQAHERVGIKDPVAPVNSDALLEDLH